jgi:hypothetical protein
MNRFESWRSMLQVAPDPQAVTALMRDHVRSLGPLAEALPENCRRMLSGDLDIHEIAVTLLRAELRFEGSDEAREFLHELAYTFASAAVRLTFLHERPRTPAVDPRA